MSERTARTAGTPPTAPDVGFVTAMHHGQRRDAARVAAAVEALRPNDRRTALALARWAAGFGDELRTHHRTEDDIFFPALAERVPSAAGVLATLDVDHHLVDALLDRFAPAVAALADPEVPLAESRPEALEVTTALRDLLRAHLDVEDADVYPLFVRHFTGAEWDALHARALKALDLRRVGFAVPWSVTCLAPEQRAAVIAGAPLPLKLIWRATRRRHDRLVAAAFAGVPAEGRPAPEVVAACG